MRTLRPMRCLVGPHGFVYVCVMRPDWAKRHIWGGLRTPAGGYDPQIRIRPRFLCSAPTPEVSSSYVSSFGSYRVDKQTNKQTNKQTDAAENTQRSSLRYDVGWHVTVASAEWTVIMFCWYVIEILKLSLVNFISQTSDTFVLRATSTWKSTNEWVHFGRITN